MRDVFEKIIYQKRVMMFWWFLGLAAMASFTLAFFPSLRNSGIQESFGNLPEALQKIAGNADTFATVRGYIGQEIFALRMPLMTIILAIAVFYGLIAGEEQRGVTETQLTMPISRTQLLIQKALGGLFVLLVASIGIVVGLAGTLPLIHESFPFVDLLKETLVCVLISLVFGMLAFMIGAVSGNKGLTLGISSGLAFFGYLISSLAPSTEKLQTVDKFTPFHYYTPQTPFDGSNVAILIAISLVFFIVGLVGFSRRDLNSR